MKNKLVASENHTTVDKRHHGRRKGNGLEEIGKFA